MADPDLQIREGPGLQKYFFRPFGPQFGLKISDGGGGGGSPSSRSATALGSEVKSHPEKRGK